MRLLPLIAGLLLATPAVAQSSDGPIREGDADHPRQPPISTIIVEPVGMLIAAFDADGDARVTRAEFDAGLKRAWASVPGGATGYIGYADWAKTWLGDANALPNPFEIDTNGDNRINFDELAGRFDLFFSRFDANKDGVIERSELVVLRNPGMQGFGRGRGKGRWRRGGGQPQ